MNVLITGGTGFIGSHTAVALAEAGHTPFLFDNTSNSSPEVRKRVETLVGTPVMLSIGDVADVAHLASVMDSYKIEAVIHMAGLKAVADSTAYPLSYYSENVGGLLAVMRAMRIVGVNRIVLSSSATVYGTPEVVPVHEDCPIAPVSPYGRTKAVCELALRDVCAVNAEFAAGALRYFNPVGAHPSGLIGESPNGTPNNLMPIIMDVALGTRTHIDIYGTDYPTLDGTCVRDYIHVMDVAEAHVAALNLSAGFQVLNIGTGAGVSVNQMLNTFEDVNKVRVPSKPADRRPGDVAIVYADVSAAERVLHWRAKRSLAQMCMDAWTFAQVQQQRAVATA